MFKAFERTFNVVERTFNDAERRFLLIVSTTFPCSIKKYS